MVNLHALSHPVPAGWYHAMYEYRCPKCHSTSVLPNVLRCPYCNKDLSQQTDELSSKHIRKCAYYLSPYQYSNRGRGRPKASHVITELGLERI